MQHFLICGQWPKVYRPYTQHIQKENNVLFSRIDRLFAKKKQEELVEDLQNLERKKMGGGPTKNFTSFSLN
jgi:hemerythrin-like domain-containing protein